jgi:four helix bundle protein
VPEIKRYSDLTVWQRAMDLVVLCYRLSDAFPRVEEFALRQQLRRAVVSVATNIAEGHGRTGIGEYLHHLSISHGSLMEVETLVQVAGRLSYVDEQTLSSLLGQADEVSRLLKGLMRALRERASDPAPIVG